ncbi:MAG: SDR family oxidoreductase [Bacteroidetes bacterium]|nr:SDR family oxidoreductase [Bacteroidota bacterium]
METVKNKHILITGATGGIGSSVARLLVSSGAHVFISGRNKERLQKLADELKLPQVAWHNADISDSGQVKQLSQKYFQAYPSVDILINCAGAGIIKPIDALEETEFLKTIHCNLFGAFLLVKNFLPKMKEAKKGLIINIPGILGKVPMAGASAYCASKYGLTGMMQCIREEVKRTEIRITNIFLGGTDTAFWDSIDLKVQRDKMVVAEEAARSIWFLCQQPTSAVVNEMVIQPFNHQAI